MDICGQITCLDVVVPRIEPDTYRVGDRMNAETGVDDPAGKENILHLKGVENMLLCLRGDRLATTLTELLRLPSSRNKSALNWCIFHDVDNRITVLTEPTCCFYDEEIFRILDNPDVYYRFTSTRHLFLS